MITDRRHAAEILKARADARQEVLVELLDLIRGLDAEQLHDYNWIQDWALGQARHGCSELADAMGGYLCICEHASFSHIYGCMATGRMS